MLYIISQDKKKYGYGLIKVEGTKIYLNGEEIALYSTEKEANQVFRDCVEKHQSSFGGEVDCIYQMPIAKSNKKGNK